MEEEEEEGWEKGRRKGRKKEKPTLMQKLGRLPYKCQNFHYISGRYCTGRAKEKAATQSCLTHYIRATPNEEVKV